MNLPGYVAGRWYEAPRDQVALPSAIDGHTVAFASSNGLNFAELVNYARSTGGSELPDERFALDGAQEGLSKRGTFVGQHILTPLRGAAVHINAFNFPCWGMLEKLAPALLAGVPVIVKPGILPAGAAQLVAGSTGNLLDQLDGQDVISFTGSLATRRFSWRSAIRSMPRSLVPTPAPARRSSICSSRKSCAR